jgi:hypothetical protein
MAGSGLALASAEPAYIDNARSCDVKTVNFVTVDLDAFPSASSVATKGILKRRGCMNSCNPDWDLTAGKEGPPPWLARVWAIG